MNTKPENEFRPDWASPPGDTIKDMLEERKMTPLELGERLGWVKLSSPGNAKAMVEDLLEGKLSINAGLAIQLEEVLGVSAEFWMNREGHYRLQLIRLGLNCKRCNNTKKVEAVCNYPGCGDSTDDHYCNLGGQEPCPDCKESKQ